ncbi:MAG: CoA-binding protein [Bacteroidia bacterium]
MLTSQLISPNSIAVVGASENRSKPGGKVLQNSLDAKYQELFMLSTKNL